MSTAIMQTGPIYDFDIIFKVSKSEHPLSLSFSSSRSEVFRKSKPNVWHILSSVHSKVAYPSQPLPNLSQMCLPELAYPSFVET